MGVKCLPGNVCPLLYGGEEDQFQLSGLVSHSLCLPGSNHGSQPHSSRGYIARPVCRPRAGSQSRGSLAQMGLNVPIPTSLLESERLTQILSEPHTSSSMALSLALPWTWFLCGARQRVSGSREPVSGHVTDHFCLSKGGMNGCEVRKSPFHGRH